MIPTLSKEQIERTLAESFRTRYKRKDVNITGILLARPEIKTSREEVLPNLDHWHYRSDYFTEFFCVGYQPFPPPHEHDVPSVVTVGGSRWYFSAESFNEILVDIEAQTSWRYRSGCYLIVANSRYDAKSDTAFVDYRRGLVVNITKAVSSGAVDSGDHLAELLFEFAKRINEGATKDPVWEFSDAMGVSVLRKSFLDYLLGLFPKPAQALFKRGEQFVVRELGASV